MKKLCIIMMAIMGLPLIVVAADRPAPEQALDVVNYYFNGKGQGALLMDYRMCSEVAPEGEDKNECRRSADAMAIPQGEDVLLWMSFLVPADDQASILVSFSRNDRVRKTAEVNLKGAIRFRTWKTIPTDKPGQWTVTIVQEMTDRDIELATLNYTVIENNP
jgi:hypothetical protein